MDTRVKFKGINYKEDDDGDTFIIKFECISDSWEKASEIKDYLEEHLANLLSGQTTLKT